MRQLSLGALRLGCSLRGLLGLVLVQGCLRLVQCLLILLGLLSGGLCGLGGFLLRGLGLLHGLLCRLLGRTVFLRVVQGLLRRLLGLVAGLFGLFQRFLCFATGFTRLLGLLNRLV